MSTITQISAAIKTTLSALDAIDKASMDGYLPPIETQKVALIMPPLGLRGSVNAPVGLRTRLVHRIPCEFWIKVNNGKPDVAMGYGREVCLSAAAELQATATPTGALGGTVKFFGDESGAPAFDWAVDDNIIQIGNGHFIRATLTVTVTDWVTLRP